MSVPTTLENRKNSGTIAFFKQELSAWILLIPSIILFYYIVWRPIGVSIGLSTFRLKGFQPIEFVGIKNYIDVISDTDFLKVMLNSAQYVGWSLLIGYPLPFIMAVFLNEIILGKDTFKFCLYLPSVIPGIAVFMIWRFFYTPDSSGILNILISFLGIQPLTWLQSAKLTIPLMIVASTWQGFGATTVLYLAALQGINKELYEAVRIDGGGVLKRITVILLPSMYGMLMLMAIKQIIVVFQILEMPLVMTGGGPNGASISIALQSYKYAFEYGQLDKGIALGVITFITLLILTIIYVWLDKKISVE